MTDLDHPVRLQLSEYGSLDALHFVPAVRRQPGPGEVEVAVKAAGLNLRDLLNTLGMLQEYYAGVLGIRRAQEVGLGLELAGVVTAVGEGVAHLAPGDRVLGPVGLEGAFATCTTLPAHTLTRIPAGLNDREAATLPLAYLTAWYALVEVAQLQPGERVLIHAAAGGVGQAAVQIARLLGAEVFATASPGKWAFLRGQGIHHLFNSRTLDFADAVRECTDGQGVDVVLNSLNGEFIPAGFAALREGGRFVEIGKVGIWIAAEAAERRPDARYRAFDLGEELAREAELASRLWGALLPHLESGALRALPCTVYPAQEAVAALRTMQQAGHVGKLVLDFTLVSPLRPEGSCLITGGLGGLGLQIARQLVDRGARHLVLVSRRGVRTPAQQAALAQLAKAGAQVDVVQADVAQVEEVRRLLSQIPALRGIVHAAGVLDDGLLRAQNPERFAAVMQPKADAAWHLHTLTQGLELDFFVAFSSMASLVGNPGQSNYAAANGFLDGLMQARRRVGLPGLSINWGPWAEVGMAAQLGKLPQGMAWISPQQGRLLFYHLLTRQTGAQVGVLPLRPQIAVPARAVGLRAELASLSAAERLQRLNTYLQDELAGVLGLAKGRAVELRARLFDLGLDSLMAVELRNKLQKGLDVQLHATLLFDYPTLELLVPYLLDLLRLDAAPAAQLREQPPVPRAAGLHEGIAIVGMGCRLPGGVETPEVFWEKLLAGFDGVRALPDRRLRDLPPSDRHLAPRGAFLERVDDFDPTFFGLSPREVVVMDPAHRLLLETAWHALEDAGIVPAALFNQEVGVFIGGGISSYMKLVEASGLDRNLYMATGNAASTAAGRISYLFGLTGPSVAVDTACSSSLTAIHQACQSLRLQECRAALAGGVNLIVDAEITEMFVNSNLLSEDAHCKTFDAAADGYVRGEGVGILVLKRLADAEQEGDRILAVIRGSAINQDGPSGGLTVPNGPSQERVIRRALAEAGVQPSEVGYIEAHGTGTPLGDPIEVGALGKVFAERSDPLYIGSVKTNIGHLEFAAGVAGLVKLVMALQKGLIPPHLHLQQPNPHIDWASLPVRVPTAATPWAPNAARRIGGVSSFGFSGTNAHVVVEEAPAPEAAITAAERPLHLLTLSARDDAALAAYARSYCDFLEAHPELDLGDVTYTSHVGRSHFSHRLSMTAGSVAELREKLVAAGTVETRIKRGVVSAQQRTPRIAFLFTGQGAQYSGMGRALYDTQPVFRESIDRCDRAFQACCGRSLVELLYPAPDTETASSQTYDLMNSHPCGQAANYALECALAELWREWGIRPAAVLGHSLGDFAAAYAAGVLGLEEGLRLVTRRGELMEQAAGEMVAVMASAQVVAPFVEPYPDAAIGVVNGPAIVVVSGARASVAAITRALQGAGFKTWRLAISVAAHSPMLDPVLDAFEEAVRATPLSAPKLPVVSSMTGSWVTEELTQPGYWRAHLRNTVQFAQGIATLHAAGTDIFLEVGPQSTLLGMASQCLDALTAGSEQVPEGDSVFSAGETAFLPSLHPDQGEWQQLLASLGELYVRGATIDWEGFDRGYSRRKIVLPTYPFQRQRYWVQSRPAGRAAAPLRPLVDQMTPLPALQTVLFETEFSVEALPFLADHRVYGEVVSPGACQIVLALHAAQLCLGEGTALKLEDVVLPQPLVLPEGQRRSVQALFKAEQAAHVFQLVSLLPASSETAALPEKTATHASGRAVPWTSPTEPSASLAALRQRCSQPVDLDSFYAGLEAAQIALGPSFRWLEAAWRSAAETPETLVRLAQPPAVESLRGYLLHPGLLDGCFQAAGLFNTSGETLLPFALESLAVQRPATAGEWWCHVTQRSPGRFDLVLLDAAGSTVAQIGGFQMRAASAAAIRGRELWQEWLYTVDWQPRPYFGLPPEFLLPPDQQVAAWQAHARVSDAERSQEAALHAAMEEVSLAFVLSAFRKAGLQLLPGALWRSEHFAGKLSLLPAYRRLLERLLEMLVEAAILQPVPAGWQVLRTPETTEPAELLAALQVEHGKRPELRLLGRCAARLHDVLRGAQEPLELLFPGGDATEATQLYSDTPTARVLNGLVQRAVSSACAQLPAERGLRILEIGAGTGGTTAGLLPLLPADRTEYLFTDIGPTFLNKAQERFSAFPFVHYQPLNIEEPPAAQDFALHQVDLIVAANVLHATRNLEETLAHVRQLLQPGGQLLLIEATERRRWLDLTFGLTDGWWRYADSCQGHPLLSPQEWQALLQAHGFAQVELLELDGQAVILAEADSLPSRLPEQSWLILADRQGVGAALASQLRQQGDQVQLVYAAHSAPPPENALSLEPSASAQEWQQLLASSWQPAGRTGTAQRPRLHGVVHLWSLDTPALPAALRQRAEPDEKAPLDLVATAEPMCASALQLAQALLQAQVEPTGFWLVTRDSQPVGPAEPLSGVLQSALWGLGKVIGLEHPELQPRCVDLNQDEDVQTQATRLRMELLHPGEDRQIALRSNARYLARLQRCTEQRAAQELTLPAGPYRLDISERGLLDALQLRPLERRAPAAGEVEIEVQADGLNFLDVLDVLGLLPFQREALGGECAGTVVRLGDGHSGLAVGDRVVALASSGFRQFVTVSAALVVPIPDVLTFAEAASIPINFLTAWYALQRIAPLRAGARVLIHAAAGGTGMAAVKIALAAGAEVYATASPAKWAVLRALGVQHLYPSRTLDFRGQILEDTDGAGVDFVLNSLTGEGFVESSLALLAPGGRFVEIAKRNIWSEDAVRAFRADVAYHILDLRAEIQHHPHEIRQQLQELLARFESGELQPVPCTTYPITQALSAFRTMQQGQHIGKIVLTAPLHRQRVSIRADATYLITGGLGGLGLASARWLAEEGARHLLLVGRSAPRAEAQAQLQALTELGVQVTVAQADVTDRTQLRAVLGQIDARCPLAGVIHSVGVLDDGALLQQRWERFVPVLAPKLQGAWNLHELTAELPLEFFVLFSSIAGLFGSRGQANHAAANAFLDSFAHYRRQQGLPALSINWGAWSEIGAAAGLVRSAARPLAEQGLGAIDPAQGIASFAWLLSQPVVQAGVAPVQWNTFLQTRKDAFYANMHQIADRPAAVAAPTTSVRQQLERAPAKERRQLLQGVLRQAVAHVLGLQDPQRIDPRQGLLEMGLDSLMAVELRNQLARTLQQPLPSTLVFDYPTIDALTDFLLQRLGEQQAEPLQTAQPLQPAPDTVSDTAPDTAPDTVSDTAVGAIAVIGMACRFPGGSDTPERFWQLLAEERDAVIALPEGRRALMSATTTAPYYGGFLQEVDGFDPAFFGISLREARLIDPQQRLLLEVGWEALERAGLQPERLFNRPVGVFVGSCSNDYALLVRQQTVDSAQMELHQITGIAQASIAGRLAYLLGFTGPAMVVDTACSSSLVALHQACQSLRSQECDLALAGGVNLILADDWVHPNAEHDKRMHAPDGRCKTFDASADGFGRGEGCGVVVLKRLSQALVEGDTILGVVRGSMVNQDGRSSGFAAPNGPSQQQVIRQAHARAGVQPAQVGYIEAHGTGTALGDPIEVSALSAVFAGRTTPLWVGSVKSNIAHLEGASGIAGVIKVLLSFQQGQIPPNVHFHSPNPYIDWEHSTVQIPVAPVAWGTAEKIAGVSSFGISGTNAHVVLAQAPAAAKKMNKPLPADERPLQLFTLSARDAAALAAYARSYCDFLETHPELDLGDLTYTGHVGRSHFSHRLSVVADTIDSLRRQLEQAEDGKVQQGVAAQTAPRVAFLFTGQGAQVVGMGQELYETEPMFRESIDRCAALLAGQLATPLLELLGYTGEAAQQHIDRTENTQPALFVLEYALAQLWRSWGIEPEILLGHSVGELAAACVAGVFSLEDGLTLVAARGQLMGALPQEGEMVSLLAAESRVREVIAPYADELSIAAVNGPASVVLSGRRAAVLAVSESLAAEGVKSQRLTVSHAFHSPLMEPMLEDFRRVAERVTYHPPRLRLVSNVTGRLAGDEIATPDYWVRHVREVVRFADGVAALHEQGIGVFLEIGPKPVLLGLAGGDSGQWSVARGQWGTGGRGQEAERTALLPSLRPGQGEWQQLLASLGVLYVRGAAIDWEGFDRGYGRRKIVLPTYPFQRQRCWVQSRPAGRAAASLRPLIDQMTPLPAFQSVLFETEFSVEALPFLADHRVYGEIVSPGACQIVLALHAAQLCLGEGTALKLEDVVLPQPLVLPKGQRHSVQALFKVEQAAHTFQLASLLPASSETTALPEKTATYASGRAALWTPPTGPSASLAALRQRCSQPVDLSSFYEGLEAVQIALGPNFRWLDAAWRSAAGVPETLVRLAQPPAVESLQGYLLHPSLLDGCFQAAGLFNTSGETLLPFALESLAVQCAATAGEWWCHVTQRTPDRFDLVLLDAAGSTVAQIGGFQMRVAATIRNREPWQEWLYTVDWQPCLYFGLPPEFLSSPPQAAPDWLAAVSQRVSAQNLQQAAHLQQALEALSLDLVTAAFDSAGFHFEPGSVWRNEQIARHLGVIPAYRRLLERLLGMLAEADIFQLEPDGWRVQQRPTAHDPADLLALLQAEYGDTPELCLLARCGLKLSAVLRGTQDPLELLFPGGETSDATRLYTETPGAQLMNGLVQAAVQDACKELPVGRGLRILEVGAGTGDTTAGLLPLLPVRQSDYLFTDIEAGFLHKAAERFASYPFVRYQPLDIEQEPAAQGFQPYQADLVVAANVLHATRDLGQTLEHVRQLLLPGGQLLLLETTERRRWVDLTFGLTDGWWRYADERQGHPLLSAEGWRQQLSAHGFVDVAVLEQAGQAVIVAKAGPHASLTHRWLILADRQGVGAALASQLRQQGDTVQVVYRAGTEEEMARPAAEQVISLQPNAAQEYLQLLHPAPDRVVHLWSLDTPALPAPPDSPLLGRDGKPLDLVAAAESGCASALLLVQALLKAEVRPASLWLVTRDAQPAGGKNPVQGAIQSGLWGMGKVIELEHPELNPVCIDLPQDGDVEVQAGWLRTLLAVPAAQREQQIALRAEGQYLARLQRCRQPSAPPQPLDGDGTYLITGGLGGLGLATARWLAEQGARHLLLLGRSRPRAEAQAQVEQMAALGATMTVVQGDVADWEGMRALLAQIDPAHPLRGVIHSVGVLDDAALQQQSWSRFTPVLTPKLQGAWNLHVLTQGLDLDFFVLFSSAVSLLGNPGQANYAAANAFLDALVHHRRQQRLPALSINWGPWSEIGVAAEIARKIQAGQGRAGIGVIAPASGAAAFAHLLTQPQAQVGVVPIHWPQFLAGKETEQTYFAEFRRTLPVPSTASVQSIYRQLMAAAPKKRTSLMRTYVQEVVAQTLQATQPLAADVGFSDLGMDSLMAIELRRRLEKGLQMAIPSTIAFEYPTIDALAGFLLRKLGEHQAEPLAPQTNQPLQPAPDTAVDVTVVPVEPIEERTDEESVESQLRWLETILKG